MATPYLACPECGWRSTGGVADGLAWVRRAGMLTREPNPTAELIAELLPVAAGKLRCPDCGHQGLHSAPADRGSSAAVAQSDDDEWEDIKRCESCGAPIDNERLEILPDTKFCVSCQDGAEQGNVTVEDEYCLRCGSPMIVRQSGRRGITRYEQVCTDPSCRRRRS